MKRVEKHCYVDRYKNVDSSFRHVHAIDILTLLMLLAGDYVSRESDESVVRHQDLEEGGHHQEGRGRSHHDRKESPSGKRHPRYC